MMGGLTSFPVPLVERVSVGIMASYGLIQKAKPTRENERGKEAETKAVAQGGSPA